MITDTVLGCVIMVAMAVGLFLSVMLFIQLIYLLWRAWKDEEDNK